MAQFAPAMAVLTLDEGGYSCNPEDPGGETYAGISRRFWKQWPGWKLVDAAKAAPNFPRSLDTNPAVQLQVISFYKTYYWNFGALNSQAIATKLFDTAVNVGTREANDFLQSALNALANANLTVDGVLGAFTIASANEFPNELALLDGIRSQQAKYYEDIVAEDPSQAVFLKGWLHRANS